MLSVLFVGHLLNVTTCRSIPLKCMAIWWTALLPSYNPTLPISVRVVPHPVLHQGRMAFPVTTCTCSHLRVPWYSMRRCLHLLIKSHYCKYNFFTQLTCKLVFCKACLKFSFCQLNVSFVIFQEIKPLKIERTKFFAVQITCYAVVCCFIYVLCSIQYKLSTRIVQYCTIVTLFLQLPQFK